MSENYSTPESIFTVPEDIKPLEVEDALSHSISRVRGVLSTLGMSFEINFTVQTCF